MTDFLVILKSLEGFFPKNFKVFESIIKAILTMNGAKTMLNISRWTNGNACYRTIERFYDRDIKWLQMNLMLIFSFEKPETILIATDETIEGKAGKRTKGIDMFFSSILQKPIKSVCFSVISIVIPEKKKSYPIMSNQLIYTDKDKLIKVTSKKNKLSIKKDKKKSGRPKGSKNKPKYVVELAPTFRLLDQQLTELNKNLTHPKKHFLGDGKYANNTVVKLCKEQGLELISKLRSNSSLFFAPIHNEIKTKKRKYGDKLNYENIPKEYLVKEEIKDKCITKTYQIRLLSKTFDEKINVVVIQKTIGKKIAHVSFLSSDLDLPHDKVIEYYSSRFQIEFNFRDAKEFWGLSEFMNTKEKRIHNASNLSLFMCTLSAILLDKFRENEEKPKSGIRDLLSFCKAQYYWNNSIKLLSNFNNNIIIPDSIKNITSMGAIHL